MALDCLIDYIGVQGCSATTPDSGIYITQLAGIELEMIDKISNEQQQDFTGVWADVQMRAARRFSTDVRSIFNRNYKLMPIAYSIDLDKRIDTSTTFAAGTDYRGFTIERNLATENYVSSNMQQTYIQDLYLYSDYVGAVDIKIIDLDTNTVLLTKSHTTTIGWNTIRILGEYSARRIFVAYDATNITSVSKDLTDYKRAINGSQTSYYNNNGYLAYNLFDECGCELWLKGGTSTIAAPYTVTEGNDSFGFSGVFSVKCSFDQFVCNNLKQFETAWLYCLGIELMHERLYSNRINRYTVFDRNTAKSLKQHFEVYYRGGTIDEMEYVGELDKAIEGINMDTADCCLDVEALISFKDAKL